MINECTFLWHGKWLCRAVKMTMLNNCMVWLFLMWLFCSCIGSIQHLKGKYGRGYSLEIKLREELTGLQQVALLHKEILRIFPHAARQERYVCGCFTVIVQKGCIISGWELTDILKKYFVEFSTAVTKQYVPVWSCWYLCCPVVLQFCHLDGL